MCVTDLDLDLEIAEGEQTPIDDRYAGVAWGLAETNVEDVAKPS